MIFDLLDLLERVRKLSDTFEIAAINTTGLERFTRLPNGTPFDPVFLAEARRIEHEAHALSERIDKFHDNIKRRATVENSRRGTPPPG